jgi:hypothetical protein
MDLPLDVTMDQLLPPRVFEISQMISATIRKMIINPVHIPALKISPMTEHELKKTVIMLNKRNI